MKSCVPAELFLIDNFRMAAFAYFVTSVSNRAGGQFGDGVTPVMSVLAKGLRNHRRTHDDEGDHRNEHHGCEAKKVFGILEQSLT